MTTQCLTSGRRHNRSVEKRGEISCAFTPVFIFLIFWMILPSAYGQNVEDYEVETVKNPSTASVRGSSDPDLPQIADLIVTYSNEFRKKMGRQKVATGPELREATQYFANYMARTDAYGHAADGNRPSERAKQHGYEYCIVSENIAYQYRPIGSTTKALAKGFFQGWKHSPDHRKNLLDPAVTEIGVAVAQSEETGFYYAVQMFGRPRSNSIEFSIENQLGSAVRYRIDTRTFSLPPWYTRMHRQCRPSPLIFQWQGRGKTIQPQQGKQYIVMRDKSGQLKIK
jgi:uncharacterized protein YkwD